MTKSALTVLWTDSVFDHKDWTQLPSLFSVLSDPCIISCDSRSFNNHSIAPRRDADRNEGRLSAQLTSDPLLPSNRQRQWRMQVNVHKWYTAERSGLYCLCFPACTSHSPSSNIILGSDYEERNVTELINHSACFFIQLTIFALKPLTGLNIFLLHFHIMSTLLSQFKV